MRRRQSRRDRGVALILVMTVMLALSIIATPFVLSMLLQEQGATQSRYASQADSGADGVRNFAAWRLMRGLDPLERRYPAGAFASYFFDTFLETEIRIDDPYLKQAGVLNPKGPIWGLNVQDEQGKLNLRTAPGSAVQRLQAMFANQAIDSKDFLTIYSGRDAGWIYPQRIRGLGTGGTETGPDDPGVYAVTVDRAFHYGKGSRLRVSKPGRRPIEVTISENLLTRASKPVNAVVTDPPVDSAFLNGVVEVEARHPVNLNTARKETVRAMFEGLKLFNTPDAVDRAAAATVAEAFAGKQTTRIEDFLVRLATLNLTNTQKAAVATNAIDPTNAYLEGRGSVPACFKSHDVYTIEALASMSNPAGSEVAGRAFRSVVSVSTPSPLVRLVESQYDFEQMLGFATAQDPRFAGFPYGHHVITFPNVLPTVSDTALKPQQVGDREAFIKPITSRDLRGRSQYERYIQERLHYDDRQEGVSLTGGATTWAWKRVFCTDPAEPQDVLQQWPTIAPGGIEFWLRFDRVKDPMTILDIKEDDWVNRLTLRVEKGELILTVCDSTIDSNKYASDNGASEIRQPFTPLASTDYHFSIYWKSNQQSQVALLVDGFAHPDQKFNHVNPEGTKIQTRLAADLIDTATNISLEQSGFVVPADGYSLIIGDEVVDWDPVAGALRRDSRRPWGVDDVPRFHAKESLVNLWGYSAKLRNETIVAIYGDNQLPLTPYSVLKKGGGTLMSTVGQQPQATVAGDKMNMGQFYIDPMQTDIGVNAGNIMDFPEPGYITIQGEVIYYSGRSTGGINARGNAKFTGCQRGDVNGHGTASAQHNDGQQVRLWGFPVDTNLEYLDSTIVQLDDEWFHVRKDTQKKNFWIGFLNPMNNPPTPLNLRRGLVVFGSQGAGHGPGTKVIPTFAIRDSDVSVRTQDAWTGDRVTLIHPSDTRETRIIRRAGPMPVQGDTPQIIQQQMDFVTNRWQGQFTRGTQIVALSDFTTQDYPADGLHGRLLKFPSGETLSLTWLQKENPNVSAGPLAGLIDEVKFHAMTHEHQGVNTAMAAGGATVSIRRIGLMNEFLGGGLFKVGNEYVGYGSLTAAATGGSGVATMVKRGWLRSTGEVQDAGQKIMYLPYVPVSTLVNDITETDRVLLLNQSYVVPPPGRPGWVTMGLPQYTEGYVLIGDELAMFNWLEGNRRALVMPPTFDGSNGLFRGMFGTRAQAHKKDEVLVYGLPWRFYDTFKQEQFDNRMTYFQWSMRMDQARWKGLSWVQEIPENDPKILVHALVRLDGEGELFEAPGIGEDKLVYEFLDPAAKNTIERVGFRRDAGQFDVRFVVQWRPGSFDATKPWDAHSWKRAPKIKEIRVEYDRPTRVLYHEEK